MPLINKNCIRCNKEYQVPEWRKDKSKYCSIECKDNRSSENYIPCAVCNKIFYRPASRLKTSVCCSIKCRGLLQRTNQLPPKDVPGVRKWLKRRNMITECEDCGYSKHPEILVVHHRDRDRTNNNLFNLAFLCPNCHALEHYAENKKGFSHASTKRRQSLRNKQEYQGNV